MLSRPGFSIRRLISQNRPGNGHSDFDSSDDEDIVSIKAVEVEGRRSRKASRSPAKKPSPKPILVVRRSGSLHRISEPVPPLPDTPYSSASSLCSCDNHHNSARLQGSRSPGLCPVGSKTVDSRPHTSPHPSPRGAAQPVPHSIQILREGLGSPYDQEAPTLNFLEALAIEPDTKSRTSSPAGRTTPRAPSALETRPDELSETVQQLIRETDAAFKAVGSALAEARVASGEQFSTVSPVSPTFTRPRKAPPPTPQRGVLKKTPKTLPPSSPLRSPARKSSVTKSRKQRPSKRAKAMEQSLRAAPAQKSGAARRTLTDNVTELFGGRLFHRIEADEMLTPSRLQELRLNRTSQLQRKRSNDTLRTVETDGSDTPIEPFHLEDLPSRIGAAGVRLTVPSPIEEVPTPRSFVFSQDVVRQDFSVPAAKKGTETGKAPAPAPAGGEPMTFRDVAFPAPPSRNPMRGAGPRKTAAALAAIPEVTVTNAAGVTANKAGPLPSVPTKPAGKPTASLLDSLVPKPSDTFLYLACAPFTLTMPTMRHGPVRFAKADLRMEPQLPADETLDWTAFQMAISGAGEWLSDHSLDGTSAAIDAEDEADELAEWCAAMGLAVGELETAAPTQSGAGTPTAPSPARAEGESARTGESPATSSDASPTTPTAPAGQEMVQSLPIPVLSEHHPASYYWNPTAPGGGAPLAGLDAGRLIAASSMGLRRWTGEGRPPRPSYTVPGFGQPRAPGVGANKKDRASVESMPQSPLNLVVSRGTDGGEYVVSMGYNLHHDLGDYLRWEAENVYAGGFTTTP